MTSSVEFLLAPISPASPSGDDIRYSPSYDLVRSLHRQAQTENSVAAWRLAAEQLESLLRNQSKDLFVAAWLTEAWARLNGFAGASAGLDLLAGMMDTYWDSLYPALDEEDASAEPRVGVLEWLEGPFVAVVAEIPITRGPAAVYNVLQLEAHRRFGAHAGGLGPSAEEVEEALSLTGAEVLQELVGALDAAGRSLTQLASVVSRRFGSEGASAFRRLREVFDTARGFAAAELHRVASVATQLAELQSTVVTAPIDAAPQPAAQALEGTDAIASVRHRAQALYVGGQVEDAVREWQAAVNAALSGRERFMLRLALGEFCLEVGFADVARHVLDGVCTDIEARRLDEWEERHTLSRAWAALYRACMAVGDDAAARGAYAYARLCELDAARAVGLRGGQPPVFESKSQ